MLSTVWYKPNFYVIEVHYFVIDNGQFIWFSCKNFLLNKIKIQN